MRSITIHFLLAVAVAATIPACASRPRWTPTPGTKHLSRSITFDASALTLHDAASRETFIASLCAAFASKGLSLQTARYTRTITHNWTQEGRADQGDAEQIWMYAERVTPLTFTVAGKERSLRHNFSATLEVLGNRAGVDFDTGNDKTEARMVELDAALHPRDAYGSPATESAVRAERQESFQRFKQALLDFLPNAEYQEREGRPR